MLIVNFIISNSYNLPGICLAKLLSLRLTRSQSMSIKLKVIEKLLNSAKPVGYIALLIAEYFKSAIVILNQLALA